MRLSYLCKHENHANQILNTYVFELIYNLIGYYQKNEVNQSDAILLLFNVNQPLQKTSLTIFHLGFLSTTFKALFSSLTSARPLTALFTKPPYSLPPYRMTSGGCSCQWLPLTANGHFPVPQEFYQANQWNGREPRSHRLCE